MQLRRKPAALRGGLIAASCALLGTARAQAQAPPGQASGAEGKAGQVPWVIDADLAYYHENGRIQAIEPVVTAEKGVSDGELTNLGLTVDSLSGASPNGALTSNQPQTFSSPSGKPQHGYTTAPGQLPVDPHYHDQRIALTGSWQVPSSRLTRWTLGAKFSYEHDFFSVTGSAAIAHDFNERNTTLSLGLYDENDTIRPIGGTPVPGSDYSFVEREKNSHDGKNGVGALLSLTQIMNRHWLAQLNLSWDRFSGYLNDPYKIMSVIDASGITDGYLYERRPQQRTRESVYLDSRVGWQRASVDLVMRYFTDSWHVHSDTVRIRFRWWNPDRTVYWEPSLRWYRQTAADFYYPWMPLTDTSQVTLASADRRLAAFHALTYGVEYGLQLGNPFEHPRQLTFRIEYYQQTVDQTIPAPSPLQGLDLYPGLTAILVQLGYRF